MNVETRYHIGTPGIKWGDAEKQDGDGGLMRSRRYFADAFGRLVIPDALGRVTAEVLAGPDSYVDLWFGGAAHP